MDKRTIYIVVAVVIVLALLGYSMGWFRSAPPPPAPPAVAPAAPAPTTAPAPTQPAAPAQ